MHENRETSLPTARASGSPAGEGESRTSGMHGSEESDGAVVPMKPSNKAKGKSPEAAEMVEGRAPTKENVQQARAVPAQYGASTSQGLKGVRKAASFAAISSKVGAVCGSSARTDLCGGRPAMVVPTATNRTLSSAIHRFRGATLLGVAALLFYAAAARPLRPWKK